MMERPSDMRYMHGTMGSHNSSILGDNKDNRNNREVDTIEFEKSKYF